jgi:hypothetical protein
LTPAHAPAAAGVHAQSKIDAARTSLIALF